MQTKLLIYTENTLAAEVGGDEKGAKEAAKVLAQVLADVYNMDIGIYKDCGEFIELVEVVKPTEQVPGMITLH